VDFVGRASDRFSISGTVTFNGQGLAGVRINAGNIAFATTAADGTYTVSGLQAGTYGVVASKLGYRFTPPIINGIEVGPGDATDVDFTAQRGTGGGGATLRLRLKPSSVKGGKKVTGTVSLSPAPTEDTTILLTSSDPDLAQVPDSVVIRARKKSAKFRIQTTRPSRTTTVAITAATEDGLTVDLPLKVKR
jgi:hypothetical protein